MATGSRGDVRWALAVGGVVGLLCGGIMLTAALGNYGHSSWAARFIARLPYWGLWGGIPAGPSLLIVGFLCALLLVAMYHWALLTAAVLIVVSILALITAALPKRRGKSRKPAPATHWNEA